MPNKLTRPIDDIQPRGVFTTEFWLTLAAMLAATIALLAGAIPAETWTFIVGGGAGAYALSRGIAKN